MRSFWRGFKEALFNIYCRVSLYNLGMYFGYGLLLFVALVIGAFLAIHFGINVQEIIK